MAEAVAPPAAVMRRPKRVRRWRASSLHPTQIVVLSFALVISVGTVLLSLPLAKADGRRLPLIDAFFTAASATCVTGLAVVDTGTVFSVFGQVVILACIQIGGLGLMTLTTVFLVASGRRLAVADRIAIQESFHHSPSGKLGTLVVYIIVATLITEAIGSALLASWWLYSGAFASAGDAVYHALFHAVSAFCNAGFSLNADNLTRFRSDAVTVGIISGLIIAGGLGFLASLDVKEYLQQRYGSRLWPRRIRQRVEAIRPRPRLSLHTKLVLVTTCALLVIGFVSYYLLERGGALREMGLGEALLNAWFCSVTARTAGFNTVDYGRLGGATLLCTMVLMFIGASPGSAGGGIKTSTFGLLVSYAMFRWRGHSAPHVFRRSIPRETIDRAGSVVIAAVGVVIIAGSFLMALESRAEDPIDSQAQFLPVIFETFSAFGTVGLSMGLTTSLSSAGKLTLILLMFIGRVGPLTLALSIAARQRRPEFRYAEENVMVG